MSFGKARSHVHAILGELPIYGLWEDRSNISRLARYFLNGYLKGEDAPDEDLRRAGYEKQLDEKLSAHVFHHEPTGIKVWSEALDLSTPGRQTQE